MVLCRTRMSRLFSRGLVPLCLLVLAVSCGYGLARPGASKPAGADERLRELMTQRYEILQRAMKNSERLLEVGRVNYPDHRNLTIALYRAQADLCTTDADRVKVYEKLVDALSTQEKWLERQVAGGRALEGQVDEGRVATLNAQIDLERLRLGQAPSQP